MLTKRKISCKPLVIIISYNIRSATVVRIDVPYCGGIENSVRRTLMASGKFIPRKVVTIG